MTPELKKWLEDTSSDKMHESHHEALKHVMSILIYSEEHWRKYISRPFLEPYVVLSSIGEMTIDPDKRGRYVLLAWNYGTTRILELDVDANGCIDGFYRNRATNETYSFEVDFLKDPKKLLDTDFMKYLNIISHEKHVADDAKKI